MEINRLVELIEESILLELGAASLYKLFSKALPEDHVFWWQLHLEEKSHARLIRTAKDSLIKRSVFPVPLVGDSIHELKQTNATINELIEHHKANPPTRHEACTTAIALETGVGECHYTQFMNKHADTATETVFQQLNKGDKDHEQRIREYLAALPADV